MKLISYFFILILFIANLSLANDEISADKVILRIQQGGSIQLSLGVGGTADLERYEEVDFAAEIVIFSKGRKVKSVPVRLSFGASVGLTAGFAGAIDGGMTFYNFQDKTIGELLGEFRGIRSGVTFTLLGISSFTGKNDYSTQLSSVDFRMGLNIDIATLTSVILTESNQTQDEDLDILLK